LASKGAALLRRLKRLGATVTVTVHYGTAKSVTASRRITIQAPGQ